MLVNYGFCLRYNKYNSLGFKVFVNYEENATSQQFQKVIRMKLHKLSLDLLQYLRANLVFSYPFDSEEIRQQVTVSTPVDLQFEMYIIEQAIQLIKTILEGKYKTTYEQDLQLLDEL